MINLRSNITGLENAEDANARRKRMWPGLGLIVYFLDVSKASKQRGRSGQLPLNLQLMRLRAWEN